MSHTDKIASRWLTTARDLARRKARERNGLFVAEGVRTVEELVRSPLAIEGALVTERALSDERAAKVIGAINARAVPVQQVTDIEFDSAADTEHAQGILAIARKPRRSFHELAKSDRSRLLILDAIQDPGNVGTLIRTAAGLGATAVVALPGTVDLWNAKVVRSAVGAHFAFPAFDATLDETLAYLGGHHIVLWGTDAGGTAIESATAPSHLAIAVGNEGGGLSEAVRARCASIVSLPMSSAVESFNVSVAAGIVLYALR